MYSVLVLSFFATAEKDRFLYTTKTFRNFVDFQSNKKKKLQKQKQT